jgi:hypothetical protein
MKKRGVLAFLFFIILTVGTVVAGDRRAGDYLPLESGRVQEYRCVMSIGGQDRVKEKVTVSYYPAAEFPGKNLTIRRYDYTGELNTLVPKDKFCRYADQLFFDYLGTNQQGVYLHARQYQSGKTPSVLVQPEFLLKNPVQEGTVWQGKDGQYRIAEVQESVQVPAGNFSGCIRVDLSPATGPSRLSSWYAPQVGLVQSHRTFPNGEETCQLLSLKK